LDYHLWGHIKSLVYAVKSSTRAGLFIRHESLLLWGLLFHFHEGPQCA
jgi:hypothetical protein